MSDTSAESVIAQFRSAGAYPRDERLSRGPCAAIECLEEIPCNPCETSCPTGAIVVGEPITNLPRLDENKCTGCGQCVTVCPGLAAFILDGSYSDGEAAVSMLHELLPIPAEGDEVTALDREGKAVCEACVVRVRRPRKEPGIAIVTLAVPRVYVHVVRSFRCPDQKRSTCVAVAK